MHSRQQLLHFRKVLRLERRNQPRSLGSLLALELILLVLGEALAIGRERRGVVVGVVRNTGGGIEHTCAFEVLGEDWIIFTLL